MRSHRSLKILYLVPDLFGLPNGIARYCRMVCQALLDSHIEVSVIALHDHTETKTHESSHIITSSYIACNGSRARFIQHALSFIGQKKPDIILIGHIHFALLGWITAKLTGSKTITFIYGIDAWEHLSLIRRWSLLQMDLILSISQYTANRAIASNRLNPKKIALLPNGIDLNFSYASQQSDSAQHPTLLTVSRISHLEEYKGHDYVIRAIPRLLEKFPGLVYNIVGDGTGRARLETIVNELGLSGSINFLGRISEDDLNHQYQAATIFIMPSRAEGFGFVFLEAMARGLPVIGGNVDATPEVIIDGETGFTVNPTSVDDIVVAVSRLLADSELRHRMAVAGKAHAHRKYGFAKFQATLEKHLAELETPL